MELIFDCASWADLCNNSIGFIQFSLFKFHPLALITLLLLHIHLSVWQLHSYIYIYRVEWLRGDIMWCTMKGILIRGEGKNRIEIIDTSLSILIST